jgi:hypothetical protein
MGRSKAVLFEPIPNFVSNVLALVITFLLNRRTIASAERDGIYCPERSNQNNQNEKTAHTTKSTCSTTITIGTRRVAYFGRYHYTPCSVT